MARIEIKRQLSQTARELKRRVAQSMRDRGGALARGKLYAAATGRCGAIATKTAPDVAVALEAR